MSVYIDAALGYARAVVAGDLVACKWVRLVCQHPAPAVAQSFCREPAPL